MDIKIRERSIPASFTRQQGVEATPQGQKEVCFSRANRTPLSSRVLAYLTTFSLSLLMCVMGPQPPSPRAGAGLAEII